MKFRYLVSAVFFLTLFPPQLPAQIKSWDYLIQGALVVDGSGSRPRRLDVAISRNRIAAVGSLNPEQSRRVLDGRGLYLIPGLVDTHTHSDLNAWVYPGLANKIFQGVTSEIAGNCGMSGAPVLGGQREHMAAVWGREGVRVPGEVPWKLFSDYRSWQNRRGLMANLGSLVGHGNLRAAVMGYEDRSATDEEIARMQALLGQAMEQGALGVSYGLIYLPGIYAEEKELTALCRTTAAYGGVCAFHMRSEGAKLLESIDEVLRIGEQAGARIEISHLKAAGRGNWDKIGQAFQKIEAARVRGIQVWADAYPYEGSAAELGVVLPDELYKREDRDELFKNAARRDELVAQLQDYFRENPRNWESVMVASVKAADDRDKQGKTIASLAAVQTTQPERVLADLLANSDFEVSAFFFSQSSDVIRRVLGKPYVFAGSDSIADGGDYPHPRAYGTFPKILSEVLASGDESALAAFVHKNAAEAAAHFGLRGRGRIREGYFADLVVLDPLKLKDLATYGHPKVLSRGIAWVFVNGVPVVADGRLQQKERPGRVLERLSDAV